MEANETLALKGREIYNKSLKQVLEPKSKGKFVAIEVESGDYFLGSTITEAVNKGKHKHPTKLFYVMRVGCRAAVSILRTEILMRIP